MEGKKVRFGVMLGPGQAEVHEGVLPVPGAEELLLKMEVCNICTEDYQRWLGLREFAPPMADGHEYIGRIIAKGEKVIDDFQVGDRVGKLNQQCGVCDDCRSGRSGDCQYADHKAVGLEDYNGMKGFADYKVIPQRLAVKVSNSIPADEAAFLEPLATVIQGLKRLRIKPFETVVVIGAGTMGLLNAQAARLYGARVIQTEISAKKLNRAESISGIEVIDARQMDPVEEVRKRTGGKGADAVIYSVADSTAYQQGYAMLKKLKGRLLFFPAGYPEPVFPFSSNEIHYRKIELIGTINADNVDFIEASKILSNRMIDVSKSLEQKKIPLSSFAEALEAAAAKDAYRISVDLQK